MQKVILATPDGQEVSTTNPLPVHDLTGGGGGGGGAYTIADGADVALGATIDAPSSPTAASTVAPETGIGLWKGIKNVLILIKDALGIKTGAAVVTDADGTVQQYLRGIVKLIVAGLTIKIDQVTAGANHVEIVGMAVPATMTPYNLELTLAVTEYSQALPANCLKFHFQCRTANEVRWQIVTGKVAGPTAPYLTLKAGQPYDSPDINQGASPSTLYFASATAGVVMEIVAWT